MQEFELTTICSSCDRHLMTGLNAIFENDDRGNRLYDTNRPLHYAEGGCIIIIIAPFLDKLKNIVLSKISACKHLS